MQKMGSKKTSSFGRKKTKSRSNKQVSGSYIGAALVPPATLSALGKSPPPPSSGIVPELDLQGSSGVLSASILNNLFSSTVQDGHSTEETDTSLADYRNAKPTMQSTFGSHDFSNGASRLAPPHGFGNEDDDSETDIRGSPLHSEHTFQVEVEHSPIYSAIQPQSQKLSRSPSPSSLKRSGQHLEQSGSVPRSSLLRSSAGSPTFSSAYSGTSGSGSRRSHPGRRNLEQHIESQMVEKTSLQSSIEKTLTRISTDLSCSGSLRLNTLREQNSALVEKQKHLEEQLSELRNLQEEVMSKLGEHGLLASCSMDRSSQEIGSVIQETQRSTEKTLDKQQELIASLKEQVRVAEEAKKELEEINQNLQHEVASLFKLSSSREEDDSTGQSSIVRKLKDERDILQANTIKLNAELSRYQAKFRPLTQTEMDTLPGIPFHGPKPAWLINTKYLAPLLVSYDDQLRDKEILIEEAESALEELRVQLEEVVKENQRLHIRLEQTGASGPVGMTEWRTMQEQCKLVIEENQLLMEQVEVQQRKATDMTKAHAQEVTKLSKRVIIAEAECNQLEEEVKELREKLSKMKEEHNNTLIECSTKLGLEEHSTTVVQLKRTFEEERAKHVAELESLQNKIKELATEKKNLSIRIEELKAENQTLSAELKVLHKSYKKAQKKIQMLKQALQDAAVKEETAERYLASIIKVAEKVTKERDSFVEAAHTEQRQKKAAINKVIEGNVAKSKAEEKLKLVKSKAVDKLEKAMLRIKEQDDDFSKQRLEYEREIKHLRLLLRERQDMIDSALGDKRRVEDDLETMWQVAAADNQRMRETLEKSIGKLSEHGNLRVAMEEMERDSQFIPCDSDQDK